MPNAMTLVDQPTQFRPGEQAVLSMQTDSQSALNYLRDVTIRAFHALWDEVGMRQAKLDVIGTNGRSAFEQHARTVQFLIESGVTMNPVDFTPPVSYQINNDGTVTIL